MFLDSTYKCSFKEKSQLQDFLFSFKFAEEKFLLFPHKCRVVTPACLPSWAGRLRT